MATQGPTVGAVKAIKCVLVGDGATWNPMTSWRPGLPTPGRPEKNWKRDLFRSYTQTKEHEVFDNNTKTVMVAGEPYTLCLFDTSSFKGVDQLRPSSYQDTDVFLVVFSIVNPASFENIKDKWVPEIRLHKAGMPFLLVGTQIELRNDEHITEQLAENKYELITSPITTEQGDSLAKQLKAVKYVECSTMTQEGVENVFEEAIIAAMNPQQPK